MIGGLLHQMNMQKGSPAKLKNISSLPYTRAVVLPSLF